MITIFVPAYNEEKILEKNILFLNDFLKRNLGEYQLIILDSNSEDRTGEIAKKLEKEIKEIKYLNINSPGKGGKLKIATLKIKSEIYAFIDADLPIKLNEFLEIINCIKFNRADLALSFRKKSKRPLIRKIVSKIGHIILMISLGIKIKDVFAGAKAWNKKVVEKAWPFVEDAGWFFDVELIYYSEKSKLRIMEVPVIYYDEGSGRQFNVFKGIFYITTKLIKFIFKHYL